MIKVVVDTNVVVSATLVAEGPSAAILDLVGNGKIRVVVSEAVLGEYGDVLRRRRFKLSPERIEDVLGVIRANSVRVKPTRRLHVSPDEPDNRFYECAEAGEAEYLITGNTADFPMNHGTAQIVTPRAFIELFLRQILQQ